MCSSGVVWQKGNPNSYCYNASMDSVEGLAQEIYRRLDQAYGHPVWRHPLPPLDELVSTILSQNTNDANRDQAFTSLVRRFPSWDAVRDASPSEVIEAIRSAGLANQKGPRIQAILREITTQRGALDLNFLSEIPADEARAWLLRFKGVGPKTAAIVLLFSMGSPAFPVDTHIHRVTLRLGLLPSRTTAEAAHKILESLFPPLNYYDLHLNLIRHGREVCHARKPDCAHCFLRDLCAYSRRQRARPQSEAAAKGITTLRGLKGRGRNRGGRASESSTAPAGT
jgi:endonuclease-3